MTKPSTRIISTIMTIIIAVTMIAGLGVASAGAAAKTPAYTVNNPTGITQTDAKISAKITNPAKTKITKVGFQMGTKSGTWTINKYDSVNMTDSTVTATYQMSKYKVTLKANTTYYYRFYMTTGGKTTYSAVKNFKTVGDPSFTVNKATGVTSSDAKISATITNPAKAKITKVGFQLGTKSGTWTVNKYDSVNMTDAKVTATYQMSKYKAGLKAGTTYYYRFYMTAGGKTYYSGVNSFTTSKADDTSTKATNSSEILFPLPQSKTWYASTYVGHGGSLAGSYSSVDITLKNGGSCAGTSVYAVEEGTVVSVIKDNGQVVIKHTKKLVTTNGKTYTTWYSIYAHMTDINLKAGDTVRRGQTIGKVGAVGNASGPHLHFGLTSGNNGSTWYQETDKTKAISPYYVNGFVDAKGNDKGYCVCDRQGTGVKNQLINWAPTGN